MRGLSQRQFWVQYCLHISIASGCLSLMRSRLRFLYLCPRIYCGKLHNLTLCLQPILLRISTLGRPDVVRALTNTKHYGLIHGDHLFRFGSPTDRRLTVNKGLRGAAGLLTHGVARIFNPPARPPRVSCRSAQDPQGDEGYHLLILVTAAVAAQSSRAGGRGRWLSVRIRGLLNPSKGPVRLPLAAPCFRRDRAQPSEKPLFYLRMPAVLGAS